MNTAVILKRPGEPDKYGQNTDIVSIYAKVRIQLVQKIVKDEHGQNIVAEGEIYSATELKNNDLIKYGDIQYKLWKVQPATDITGKVMHYKAYLI